MALPAEKIGIVQKLQSELLALQGFGRPAGMRTTSVGLPVLEQAFPNGVFPRAAVHEFLSAAPEDAAATSGFMAGIAGKLLSKKGLGIWISNRRTLFPPALKVFGIDPDRIIFIDLQQHKEALWAIEEALKCAALSVVIGEIGELSFTESRRLQLAVEQSRVTGFIHRYYPRNEQPVACVSRWRIRPVASTLIDTLPGVGFPGWDVQLLKVRNGSPGRWQVAWAADGFRMIQRNTLLQPGIQKRKAG